VSAQPHLEFPKPWIDPGRAAGGRAGPTGFPDLGGGIDKIPIKESPRRIWPGK